MFDNEFRDADDAEVVAAIAESHAAEAAAAARTLAAIAELTRRRCDDDERAMWACDGWDGAAAEVSAALGVSQGRASGQMDFAMALTQLPQVAALFLAGRITARVAYAVTWRTAMVTDPDARARIDTELAALAGGFDALSQYRLEQAIDAVVDRIDPGGLRHTRASTRSRDVQVGAQNPESGTAALWGRLLATDAAVLYRRLTEMAYGVCDDDPRTVAQRRADALGALAAGAAHLRCQCGVEGCPAGDPDGRAASVVIHVLADQAALESEPDPQMSGDGPITDESAPAVAGKAAILGGGPLPTPLLAELLRTGARVRYLRRPPGGAEPRYRPSTALDEFIRMRDLTCRFPHCDVPADRCDIDHSIPWPLGPTHPSNLHCKCRKHHLLKTFRTGPGGWSEVQHPDGSIVFTAPSGHTYVTVPGSRLLFPQWETTTAGVSAETRPPETDRGLMMPARRRTRAAQRAHRITGERSLNDARVAERTRPPPF